MPTSLAMLRRSRLLSHITRVCTTLERKTVHHPQRSTPPLKLCCPFFHCAISRRLHDVLMNFLGRHSFLTEILGNPSDFKFLHVANVSHPPLLKVLYISNHACFSHSQCPSISSNDRLTKAHFESNYSSYFSNYSSIRTSIVATIVQLEINGGSEQRYSSRLPGSLL